MIFPHCKHPPLGAATPSNGRQGPQVVVHACQKSSGLPLFSQAHEKPKETKEKEDKFHTISLCAGQQSTLVGKPPWFWLHANGFAECPFGLAKVLVYFA